MLAGGGAPIRNAVGALLVLGYYLGILAILPALARLWWGVPREPVRKAQHVAIGLSIFVWLEAFTDWVWAVAAVLLLMVVAYAVLRAVETTRLYARAMTDRGAGGGELRRQLLYMHLTLGLLITLSWGAFGPEARYLAAAAMMAWAVGDLAAFLVGRTIGRNGFRSPHIEATKTVEGSLAMAVTAFGAIVLTLHLYGGQSWGTSVLAALAAAPAAAVAEAYGRRGADTLLVPLVTGAILLPVTWLLAGIAG